MQYILGTNNIDSLRSMKCRIDMFEAAAHYLTIFWTFPSAVSVHHGSFKKKSNKNELLFHPVRLDTFDFDSSDSNSTARN